MSPNPSGMEMALEVLHRLFNVGFSFFFLILCCFNVMLITF